MGKHKFNSGRVCEHCAGYADSLPKDGNGKFLPCSEAPEEGKTKTSSVLLSSFFVLICLFPVYYHLLFLHVV
jgi:ssDNA-binding Zn-finger/Zn-ribbon topoisomerase 1